MGEVTDNQTTKIEVTGGGGPGIGGNVVGSSSGGIVGGSCGEGGIGRPPAAALAVEIGSEMWLLKEILAELRAIHATLKVKDD